MDRGERAEGLRLLKFVSVGLLIPGGMPENVARRMRWGEFEERVTTIYGLDPPIEPLIVALWAHGFPTTASRRGHTGKRLKDQDHRRA